MQSPTPPPATSRRTAPAAAAAADAATADQPKDTHHEMSARTATSVKLLTALSNLNDDGKVVLPPFIQNLHLFKKNDIAVTDDALTQAVQSFNIARKGGVTGPPPPEGPPPPPPTTTEGMSAVVLLSGQGIDHRDAAVDNDDA
jgi:hypothetical protein